MLITKICMIAKRWRHEQIERRKKTGYQLRSVPGRGKNNHYTRQNFQAVPVFKYVISKCWLVACLLARSLARPVGWLVIISCEGILGLMR
jgi:hypothetical protein